MKKITDFIKNTKLGHFLFNCIGSTILILIIWLISDIKLNANPFIIIFVLSILFALTDRNKKWY
jgi:hypothetical protein